MFEFDKYNGPRRTGTAPSHHYESFPGARDRAFLLWGEHCVECAAPDCFTTCDLYTPRPDQRCRRFVTGIHKNKAFRSATGYGAEVTFKKWGKLEARGNATLYSARCVRWMERAADLASRAINPLGRLLHRCSGDIRFSYLAFALSERLNELIRSRRNPRRLPDAFVIEIYNPTSATVTLTLSMAVNRSTLKPTVVAAQLPQPVLRRLTVAPGYFLELIPRQAFESLIESDLPFGIALTPAGEAGAHLVFLTLDFVGRPYRTNDTSSLAVPRPNTRPAAKCVVFDLDNTLWDGILVEGPVRLRPHVSRLFRELDQRGILISIASKNVHDEAIAKLTEYALEEYVIFPRINWAAKSDNLKRIAEEMDIGLDTFIVIDDNPFEREQIASALPMVEILSDVAVVTLLDHPRLQGSQTTEAGRRRQMYRESMQRRDAAVEFGDDYLAFLRSCDIEVEIRPHTQDDFERIAELVQRTNQLNFSGRKYSRDEISRLIADDTLEKYVITCSDKFGSYGTVGFCLAERLEDGVRVLDFMLSCRVQGKFVEQALFYHLTQRPRWAAKFIEVHFQRTARNQLAEVALEKLGFVITDSGRRRRSAADDDLRVNFIALKGSWPDACSENTAVDSSGVDAAGSRVTR
jgi:FkbH-like protein